MRQHHHHHDHDQLYKLSEDFILLPYDPFRHPTAAAITTTCLLLIVIAITTTTAAAWTLKFRIASDIYYWWVHVLN